jgi:hypothetical protein
MRKVDSFSFVTASAVIPFLAAIQGACSRPAAAPPTAQTTAVASAPAPVGTVKDIMKGIVDPSSAAIWDAVPDAPELTPAQIEEKVNKDRGAWDTKADALQQTAMKAIAAARAHDKDGVLNVGEEIDNACESCHKVYWYPDDVGAAASNKS